MRKTYFYTVIITAGLLFNSYKVRTQRFNFSFEQFTTDNGLSHESITNITKDLDGFLWIGTANGLNRFDGISFRVFRKETGSNQTLPGNYVAGTTLDKKGYLWVATTEGICRIDTRSLSVQKLDLRANGDSVNRYDALYGEFDSTGIGWYIVNGYLYAINQETFHWKRYKLPTTVFHANAVQIDRKNRIWLSLGRAKYLFNRQTGQFRYLMGYDDEHTNTSILCGWIKEDDDGRLWMNTWNNGFFVWNEQEQNFEPGDRFSESMTCFEFDKDEDGKKFLWCGGGAYGLMAYDPVTKNFFQFKNDPRNQYTHNLGQATTIYRDTSAGIVWIGTENGLEKYDPHAVRFHRYRIWQNKNELTNSQYFFTTGILKDRTDESGKTWWVSVWIGGVYKWNRNKFNSDESFEKVTGIKNDGIFSMVQARDGNIWIGHGLGVQVLDPRKNKFVRHYVNFFPDSTKRRTVTYLYEDSKSNMWFATYQGLFMWDRKGDSVIHWNKAIPGLQGVYIPTLREDREGNIWVSSGKGPGRIDSEKKECIFFSNKNRKGRKLPEDDIGGLYIDHQHHVWVSGINYIAELDLKGEVLNLYDNSNGYLATSLYSILEDPYHFIWLATDNKIHRLNPETGHFDYFDKTDGLFNNKVADGFNLMPNGELFIGFNGAICSINTGKIAFNTEAPKIFVSRLNVKGQIRSFDKDNKITIGPKERNLIVEFAALNYSQAQKNKFAFWLEGYDSTWRYTSDRIITLMNLEGGAHKLRVKASNNDGVWSEESIYTFNVIPPFQKTIWFRLLMLCLIGLLILAIFYYRGQQNKKLEKIRNRIATDLHDDMGSTLSSIRIFSDVAKKQIEEFKPETVQLLDRISNNATSLSENMQDIIWTIRSDNDTLEDLVSRMREFGLRVCDAKNIRFRIRVSQNFKASRLSLEQRRNLYLIFREALNNSVKYAEPAQIDLILNLRGRYLKMEIADNGKGFDPDTVKRGNGLNNLEKRTKEINGEIRIKAIPGVGTVVSLMIILKKKVGLS